MMKKKTEIVIDELKKLIEKNGYDYLAEKPISVYKKLVEQSGEKVIVGAIVMLLVTGMWDEIKNEQTAEMSAMIQKNCGFDKKMASTLSYIIGALYSEENKNKWKEKQQEGLVDFLNKKYCFKWNGFAVWEISNGSVDYSYQANIEVKPTKNAGQNKKLKRLLEKNPFMTEEAIHDFYTKSLREYLDSEFEEYITCDDYYEPVVEDFELTYSVEHWAKENGFEVIFCEGNGNEGGYEPKFTRGW